MGTDIHTIAQVYSSEERRWVTKKINVGGDLRDYRYFSALAGVRSEGWVDPIVPERGIPADLPVALYGSNVEVSAPPWHWPDPEGGEPRLTIWLGYHHHSWALLSELESGFARLPEEKLAGLDYLAEVINELCLLKKEAGVSSDHIRLVFGFDS